ncbi:phosphotransferase [Brachybacterium halotolerans subsp. kimchii]|uniref:phosphotransferase n=1 Tax=Brachybacterium halotolerans TaxID=2795215 RepID=UPI001E4B297B|nr:phosphotransferase [Brachybacterium halotolerans]UEJ81281.1 phosphotransferase [Brachybacterium halotolerans subsp. kimchii]
MPAHPLTAERLATIRAALSRITGDGVAVVSSQHVGHEWAPVTRLELDRAVPGIGPTVLVKTRRVNGAGHGGPAYLRREAAALRTAARSGVTARAILMDDAAGLLVQSDLGAWPTLQERLLGRDPTAAARAMTGMATTVGRLHAATLGRDAEHAQHLAAFAADVETGQSYAFGWEAWDEIEQACADTGLPQGGRARQEFGRLLRRAAAPGCGAVLTHLDLNPTNVLLTPDGARLVDFESSGFGHPGIDACFLHYPFPHHSAPWAVLPDAVVASADAAYRTALSAGGAARILENYDQMLADGAAIALIGRLRRLRLIAEADQTPADGRRRRGQIVQQIRTFLRIAEPTHDLSAVQEWIRALMETMVSRWPESENPPAPLFPAFAANPHVTGGAS